MKFPYKTDYNDHFETPPVAYEHILPLLDALQPDRSQHVIYDPYYCNGQTKDIFLNLGFKKIIHEKRDFYKDIMQNTVPNHHSCVTNPPYSDNHKEKCMRYLVPNMRTSESEKSKSFFVLMPNYIAIRNHFRIAIGADDNDKNPLDIFYIVPPIMYEYNHPDGTGKDFPPFASIWFCGVHPDKIDLVKEGFRKHFGSHSVGALGSRDVPHLVSTIEELRTLGAVPVEKRKNLKQRLKLKRKLNAGNEGIKVKEILHSDQQQKLNNTAGPPSQRKKKSRYRDDDGVRKKKRF